MNRIWKMLVCFSFLALFIGCTGSVAQGALVWPPAEGVYVRKNANGIPNGRISVIVKDLPYSKAVIVGVESSGYEGASHEGRDRAPYLYIAGHMDMGQTAAEVVLTHGFSDKRGQTLDPKVLPPMTQVVYKASVQEKRIVLTPIEDKNHSWRTDPDLAGTYVFEGAYTIPSRFMAIAWVRQQDPERTGLARGLDYRYEDNYVGDGPEKHYPGIGEEIKPSYELLAYDGGQLYRKFLVSNDFNQIYVIKPNGEALLIYNSEGGVG